MVRNRVAPLEPRAHILHICVSRWRRVYVCRMEASVFYYEHAWKYDIHTIHLGGNLLTLAKADFKLFMMPYTWIYRSRRGDKFALDKYSSAWHKSSLSAVYIYFIESFRQRPLSFAPALSYLHTDSALDLRVLSHCCSFPSCVRAEITTQQLCCDSPHRTHILREDTLREE